MDYVKKYGELIKDKAGVKPERARSMIRLGLRAENARTKLLPNKEMPKAFRMLTHLAMESVLKALDHPEKSCWTNIFAPVEIMQCPSPKGSCSALVCSVCPWSVCHHLCPVLK